MMDYQTKGINMTYDETLDATVTKAEAKAEIREHDGVLFTEFLTECGDHEEYNARDVLDWLGY